MGKKKNKNSNSQGVENNDVKEKINEENVVKDQETGDGGKDNGRDGVGVTAIAKNEVVLKIDLHCDGCVYKIIKRIRAFEGVVGVEVDNPSNKITVTGKVDPVKLKDKLDKKLKKKVQLLSPVPKKDDTAGKGEKNTDSKENNKNAKVLPVSTAVLKVPLHCEGCINKIVKFITKTKGYHEMKFDKQKEDLVTVTGAMDMKLLAESLKKHIKRDVEIIPPKKDKDKDKDNEKDKEKEKEKGKENAAGGGGGGGGGKGGVAVGQEVNAAGGGGGGGKGGVAVGQELVEHGNKMQQQAHGPIPCCMVDPYQVNCQAIQMFSDENPNACRFM